jgi:hypothetical protein
MNLYSGYTGKGKDGTGGDLVVAADNGLNINFPGNVELGGSLIKNTIIDGHDKNFYLIFELLKMFVINNAIFINFKSENFTWNDNANTTQFIMEFNKFILQGQSGNICPVLLFNGSDISGPVTFKPINNAQNLTDFFINEYWQVEINGVTKNIPLGIPT